MFCPLICLREWHTIFNFLKPFQIKLCGICCLASAVLCVVVTVTTTVIHMNRLQTLRECVYQGSIQTCTCFAGFFDPTMTHHDGNNHSVGELTSWLEDVPRKINRVPFFSSHIALKGKLYKGQIFIMKQFH